MITYRGRVVYDRAVHHMMWRDAARIVRSLEPVLFLDDIREYGRMFETSFLAAQRLAEANFRQIGEFLTDYLLESFLPRGAAGLVNAIEFLRDISGYENEPAVEKKSFIPLPILPGPIAIPEPAPVDYLYTNQVLIRGILQRIREALNGKE